jgi:lipopolysaccharide-induced tumor necrosis factor-alpha factor
MMNNDLPPQYNDTGITSGYSSAPPPPPGIGFMPVPQQYPERQQQQQQQTNVIYVVPSHLRDHPVHLVCPQCKASVLSRLTYESGIATWLIAGGLCLFGLGCGCCLIPFCIDSCKGIISFIYYLR